MLHRPVEPGTTYQALDPNYDKFESAMRSFMQSTLVIVLALGFPVAGDNFAQSPSLGKDIVLEVIATHTTLESEDKYVYLRVFSDGTAEWQSSLLSNSQKRKTSPSRRR